MKRVNLNHRRPMDTLLYIGLSCFLVGQGAVAIQEEKSNNDDQSSYRFRYQIHDLKTKDYKTHEEAGENGFVRGTYTVREPNGDLREVSYLAGDNKGFQAMVRIRPKFASSSKDMPEAKLTTESNTLKNSASIIDTEDTPLKFQLGTESRSYNFQYEKEEAAKIHHLPKAQHKIAKPETTPKVVAGRKISITD